MKNHIIINFIQKGLVKTMKKMVKGSPIATKTLRFRLNLQLFAEELGGNPAPAPTPSNESGTGTTPQPQEQMFTKSQINDMMQKRVNRSHQAFFNRYGVKDLGELDALVGKASYYDPIKEKYDGLVTEHETLVNDNKDLRKRYGYQMHNINPDKYADIETYFKGKGLDIDENSLLEEIKAHPDWVRQVATIQNLGPEPTPAPGKDEAAEAERIFGVKLH